MKRRVLTWEDRADRAMAKFIASGEPFSANDLYEAVGLPDPTSEPNSRNNGVGTVFSIASKRKLIVPTGETLLSIAPNRKGGMIREWIGNL